MSVRRLDPNQPQEFSFTHENQKWAEETVAKYPDGEQASAVILLLWRAQEQCGGWLPEPALRSIADMLHMAHIRVYEVATFYTMFQLSPVGRKAHVQVCGTTPCMLRGAEALKRVCQKRISPRAHQVSDDGELSWEEVECLGACVNAPMVQIWKDTYEDLSPERLAEIIDAFAAGDGESIAPGPQNGRQYSAPDGGPTTLLSYLAAVEIAIPNEDVVEVEENETRTDGDAIEVVEVTGNVIQENVLGGEVRPVGLDGPREGGADDLKLVSGIGPKIEGILNELGIYHFDQIGRWTEDNVGWVESYLSFKGRIQREGWISQAERLATGDNAMSTERSEQAADVRSKDSETGN